MCALMGVLENHNQIDKNMLETMQRAVFHRGPDDDGVE